jgi:predicted SAM-dependent methyltransferase
MTNMKDFKQESLDTIIAFDVLEHIKNDHDAFSEVHRVLTIDGIFIFSVPIQREHTHEYLDGENTGDPDHVRSCGYDYIERAVRAGFTVERVSLTLDSRIHLRADLRSSEHHPEIYIAKKITRTNN